MVHRPATLERHTSARAREENFFTLVRYGLAVLVVFSHSFTLLGGEAAPEPFVVWSRGQVGGGELAVNAFLILSGFLVTASWQRSHGVGHFLEKRARRIYPAYVAVVVVSLVLLCLIDEASRQFLARPWRHGGFFVRVLLLSLPPIPGSLPDNPIPHFINGSLWTLKYEFGCYILLALLGVIGALRRRGVMLCLFGLSWVVYAALRVTPLAAAIPYGLTLVTLARMTTFFLAGVLYYLHRDTIVYSGPMALLAGGLLLASFFGGLGFSVLEPVVGPYIVLYLCLRHRAAPRDRGDTDLSYGLYLYAFPVQQTLVLFLGAALSPYSLFLLAWACATGCAWLSWHAVERPFLRAHQGARQARGSDR